MARRSFIAVCLLGACTSNAMSGPDASLASDTAIADASGAPSASALRDAIASCATIVGGPYATDAGGPPSASNISICGLPTAVFWKADLDVDCDGKMTAHCNLAADPAYQNQTAATDSHNAPLDAETLPYIVVPSTSGAFNYSTAGLELGSVIAVIYGDKVAYGVFGDTGPATIIGEASYATAVALGIDPDPSTGGADRGVMYIAFTGTGAVTHVMEDHDEAVAIGVAHARALLGR